MEALLGEGNGRQVKALLDSDEALVEYASAQILQNARALSNLMNTTRVIHFLLSKMPKQSRSFSALYTLAMAGKLKGSPVLREMLLFLRRSPSDIMVDIASEVETLLYQQDIDSPIKHKAADISRLHQETLDSAAGPLRSEHDVRNETLRTTVVAKKIELSKQKSQLSEADAAYSGALKAFVDALQDVFDQSLVNPREMAFREVFIYDIKGPHRAAFAPKTRGALERALSSPHDYLNCDCCSSAGHNGEAQVRLSSLFVQRSLAYSSRTLFLPPSRPQPCCTSCISSRGP